MLFKVRLSGHMVASVTADFKVCIGAFACAPGRISRRIHKNSNFSTLPVIIKHHDVRDSCPEDTVVFLFVLMSRVDRAVMSRSRSPLPKIWPFHTIYSPTTWLLLRNAL